MVTFGLSWLVEEAGELVGDRFVWVDVGASDSRIVGRGAEIVLWRFKCRREGDWPRFIFPVRREVS